MREDVLASLFKHDFIFVPFVRRAAIIKKARGVFFPEEVITQITIMFQISI